MLRLSDTVALKSWAVAVKIVGSNNCQVLEKTFYLPIWNPEAIGKWYESRSRNCTSAFNEYGVSSIEKHFSFAHNGSFQVSCAMQENSTYAWEDISSISKVQCCNFYTQFLQLQQWTLNMVFSHEYFDFVIHLRRYLTFALYWTNTIRFDVEVKLWNINPEYTEVLCWLEDHSICRVNVHRVT